MKVAIYHKVPSSERGKSISPQDIREFALAQGWEIYNCYQDYVSPSGNSRRTGWIELMVDARQHKFELILIRRLDQIFRSATEAAKILKELKSAGTGLRSYSEPWFDTVSVSGGVLYHLTLSYAALEKNRQYFSEALSTHVRKGLDQRAREGKHNGCIPFGYESCWETGEKGEKKRRCEQEHPGGLHIHSREGPAAAELFRRYSSGTTTLSQLAIWLNEQGFRTRNTRNLPDANGELVSGPRLFTSSSVRNILHNPFYTGQINHRDEILAGAHEALISRELFDTVQLALKKNSGRSETLNTSPNREYLLKGLVRCAYCGMPMWAQTYKSGNSYYREHKASRSIQECPGHGGTIACHVIDNQIKELVSAIELGPGWLEEVLSIISLKDEVERVKKEKEQVTGKLHRMAKTYIDGLIPEEEYLRQKRLLELSLESLVVPDYDASEQAGKLIQNLPVLWGKANLTEQRKILLTMLDGVYVDVKQSRSVIAVKVKPPFKPIFQVAVSKKESRIRILNEPLGTSPAGSSVFLVETGEGRTPRPEKMTQDLLQD